MPEPSIHIEGDSVEGGQRNVTLSGGQYFEKGNFAAPPIGVEALHQLPAPPADFVGRERELRELAQAAQSSGVAISGLRGMGGVGKTALALKLAEALKPQFPDAQFFIRLEGASAAPLDPKDALARVIHAYAPTAQLPDDLDSLRAQYLTLLSGKRALVLLDDARDAAQVLPLLPPEGCLALVTTREYFTLPGWAARDIGLLSPAESSKLLRKIARHIKKAQADALAKLCGYHPLALRAAGGLLAATPDLAPEQLAADLHAEHARLRLAGPRAEGAVIDVDALLNLSYARLSPETVLVFRCLAVFPGDFDAAAEEIVCVDPGHAQLSELVRRSLVEYVAKSKRYRLHDLAREFAGSRLSEAERDSAQRRHAEHYKNVLSAADDLYLKGGENILRGLSLFDLERASIGAGQAWAAMHIENDEAAAQLASEYPGAGAYVLNLRQHPRERIAWLEVGLVAAQRLQARQIESNHLGNLGNAYLHLGEPRRAIEYYEQQLVITREIGDRRGESAALGNLGVAYAALGEPRRAIEYYEQSLAIKREIGDQRGEGNTLNNLGVVYADLGEPRRAIEYYEQALAIYREIGDRRNEDNVLGNLGNAYSAQGNTQQAIEYYEQALDIDRELGDRLGESIDSWNLGRVYEQQGELEKAIALTQVYVDYLRELGHPDAEKRAAYVEKLRQRLAGG